MPTLPIIEVDVSWPPERTSAWRREWCIKYLRGERDDGQGMDPPWTMSGEDIGRLLLIFEASGATPEEAESMTWFLPEGFCRRCLDAGGVHIATETDDDNVRGRRLWIAGPAPRAVLECQE